MRPFAFLLLCFFAFFGAPVHAVVGDWQETENASLRLIASNKVDESGQLYAGFHLKLHPSWHAYWRSPGDAGFPPAPDWKKSVNFASAEFLFPWPRRAAMQGLETFGYEEEVVFPVRLSLADAAQPAALKAYVNFLVCADMCIPAEFNVSLDLPASFSASAEGDEATTLLKNFLPRVPHGGDDEKLSLKSAQLVEGGGRRSLVVIYGAAAPLKDAELILEVGDGSTIAYAETSLQDEQKTFRAVLKDDAPKDLAGKDYVFTLIDHESGHAIEKKLPLIAVPAPTENGVIETMPAHPAFGAAAPAPAAPPSLWLMFVFALLGGLVLNLMPCVLPVLALKSLAFVSHGGGTPAGVRLSFLSTSAGILFSFLVMALALVGLKQAGMSVGWGVQFQHPVFLIFLIAVLVLFASSLWGLFEIPLPRFLADRLSWSHGHGNLLKDFFSGAFATLLATPCTAPFLGTAVGFALASGNTEIIAIFMGLGLGLASPFLLIALFPRTATLLPKPGNWMNALKKTMGALLALTALWLGFVLSHQLLAAPAADEGHWHVFDEAAISSHVQAGKVVLVDVTADWCLTCKANKKFVLERADVKKLLDGSGIVLMKADWTRPNEAIAAYLKKYGRYGIPFNIIYGPAAPDGVPLPELLTPAAIREALDKAGLRP